MVQESTGGEHKKQDEETDSDATSKELLSDIEETEENSGASSSDLDPGPSPDGAFDESDEIKDAGPM
jgi:hypothetical protein